MRKTDFLNRIKGEGKLQIVEPSSEIAQSYAEKSESNLISAKILLDNDRLEESVSMAYYSMYHLLTGLLFRTGIKCENHSVAITLMKDIFGMDNSYIHFAKKERIDKQYYVNFKITKDEVKDMVTKAEEFNNKLSDFIAKLNNVDIEKYRKTFRNLIK